MLRANEMSPKQEVTGGARESSKGEHGKLLSPSAVPLSPREQKGHGVTLLVQ